MVTTADISERQEFLIHNVCSRIYFLDRECLFRGRGTAVLGTADGTTY